MGGHASWRSWAFLTNLLSSFLPFFHFELEPGIGQRQPPSQNAFPSIVGRRAKKRSSKNINRHCGFHRGVVRIRSLLDLETGSLDEDGFHLRLFYSLFYIHESGDMTKRFSIVCVKTKATSIIQKSLLAASVVGMLSSPVLTQPSQSQLYIVSTIAKTRPTKPSGFSPSPL